MRYWCPVTVDDDPKWIGGVMTIRQGVYAAVAVIVGIVLVGVLHRVWVLGLFLAVLPGLAAYLLGWMVHKRSGEMMDRAIVLGRRFRRSDKVYLHKGAASNGGLAGYPQTQGHP